MRDFIRYSVALFKGEDVYHGPDRRKNSVPVPQDRRCQTGEFCTQEITIAQHEMRLASLEERCDKKEKKLENIMEVLIPAINQWQSSATGIVIGVSVSSGVISGLLVFIVMHYMK